MILYTVSDLPRARDPLAVIHLTPPLVEAMRRRCLTHRKLR